MRAIETAINNLILLRKTTADTVVHQGWLRESAIGQLLGVEQETTHMMDILCWHREDPRVIFSVPELIEAYGKQMAALSAMAIYLNQYSGVTVAELAGSYQAACGLNEEQELNELRDIYSIGTGFPGSES